MELVFIRYIALLLFLYIHPLYASIMHPTGGLIGPGDSRFTRLLERFGVGRNWPHVRRHGIAHDAFGYLYNIHKKGPGYAYVDPKIGILFDPKPHSPLADQIEGLKFWDDEEI